MLAARKATPPVAAAGYQLPMLVGRGGDAARLAARMESDGATAWRAVIERADTAGDRAFASTALTQSAVHGRKMEPSAGRQAHHDEFPGWQRSG